MENSAATVEELVNVTAGSVTLEGNLTIPPGAKGIVLFAHGSGSSRHSPRNKKVAKSLNEIGLATLLIDLLTTEEEVIDNQTRELRFDITMLAERLQGATDWLTKNEQTKHLSIGYYGSSTGAGAALVAAPLCRDSVRAVVSRGGRPDLAGDSLDSVEAATLLIVGGLDQTVIGLNQLALEKLHSEKKLEIVPGATHLFEEQGTLDQVTDLAGEWFVKHLTGSSII